jgi:hypothetical protein
MDFVRSINFLDWFHCDVVLEFFYPHRIQILNWDHHKRLASFDAL